jgi:hypothetical protein
MNPAKAYVLAAFGALALGGAVVGAEQAGRRMTSAELDRFAAHYYLHPQPELIPAAIEALGPSGFMKDRRWVFVGFFTEVFAANPDRMPEWRKLIASTHWSTRDCLQTALKLSRPGVVLSLDGRWYYRPWAILWLGNPWGRVNEMRWGAFYASGNPAFLRKVVDQLRLIDAIPSAPGSRFWEGADAMWTLARNAPEHPLVRVTLEVIRKESDPRTRDIISDVLTKDQSAIQEEIRNLGDRGKMASLPGEIRGDIGRGNRAESAGEWMPGMWRR